MRRIVFCLSLCILCSSYVEQTSRLDYMEERNALRKHEKEMGVDSLLLSREEVAADRVLQGLKAEELRRTRGHYPAQYSFLDMQKKIEEGRLLGVFQSMPKGAVMHAHTEALEHVSFWINATYRHGCYMKLAEKNATFAANSFHFFPTTPKNPEWVPLQEIRSSVSDFDSQLVNNLTITRFRGTDLTTWHHFQTGFIILSGLFLYRPLFEEYLFAAMENLYNDGVFHVEMRLTAGEPLYDMDTTYSVAELVGLMQSLVQDFRLTHPFFSLVVIYCELRSVDLDTMEDSLRTAYDLRRQYPDFVVGFDLVGEEDLGHPLLFFVPSILRVQEAMVTRGYMPMKYYFHAGETDWDSVSQNLFDALLLNSTRIGHGFSLLKHPELMELYKFNGIGIEVCPISNQLLGLLVDQRVHPAAALLSLDMPVTISPDDPMFWGITGVSYDWYVAYISWDLNLAGLKKLAQNSISQSSLPVSARRHLFHAWHRSWMTWVHQLLSLES